MLDPIGDPAKRVDIANVGLERRSMPAVVLLMLSTVSSSSASVAAAETVIMLRSDAPDRPKEVGTSVCTFGARQIVDDRFDIFFGNWGLVGFSHLVDFCLPYVTL